MHAATEYGITLKICRADAFVGGSVFCRRALTVSCWIC